MGLDGLNGGGLVGHRWVCVALAHADRHKIASTHGHPLHLALVAVPWDGVRPWPAMRVMKTYFCT
jgi:hypothetical protein